MTPIKNPFIKHAAIFTAILVVGIILLALPFNTEMNADQRLSFMIVSLPFNLAGFIGALRFTARALAFKRIVSGGQLLACWEYTPAEWQRYIEHRHQRHVKGAFLGFLLGVVGITLLGPVLTSILFDGSGGPWLIGASWLLTALVAFLTPRINYRRDIHFPKRAFISRSGIYFDSKLDTWRGPLSSIKNIHLEDSPPMLVINYSYWNRSEPASATVYVPIPASENKRVKDIVDILKSTE